MDGRSSVAACCVAKYLRIGAAILLASLISRSPKTLRLWQQQLGTGNSDSCLGILRDDRFTLVEFAADLPPLAVSIIDGKGELEDVAKQPRSLRWTWRVWGGMMLRHRMRNMDHTLSLHAPSRRMGQSPNRGTDPICRVQALYTCDENRCYACASRRGRIWT